MSLEKMQRRFVIAIAILCCTTCRAQDPSGTDDLMQSMYEAQKKLAAIGIMLPAMKSDSPEATKLREDLALVRKDIAQIRSRVDEIESALHESVMAGFAKLARRADLKWNVALRGKPVFSSPPKDIQITTEAGIVTIKKNGNSSDSPIGPSQFYQVCPDLKLNPNDRVKLRISIPPPPSKDRSTVPFFGLRDANGEEVLLGGLVEDNKEHELLIQCVGGRGFAFFDGQLTERYGKRQLVSPLHLFILLTDISELRIHDFQSSEISDPN